MVVINWGRLVVAIAVSMGTILMKIFPIETSSSEMNELWRIAFSSVTIIIVALSIGWKDK